MMAESIETSDIANKSFYSNVFVLLFIVKSLNNFALSDLLKKTCQTITENVRWEGAVDHTIRENVSWEGPVGQTIRGNVCWEGPVGRKC